MAIVDRPDQPLYILSHWVCGVDSWSRSAQSFAADTLTMTHTCSLWLTVISGTALDPLADKITMLFIYSAFYLHNDIPSWLFMTIIGRDIALVRHSLIQNVLAVLDFQIPYFRPEIPGFYPRCLLTKQNHGRKPECPQWQYRRELGTLRSMTARTSSS